MRDRNEKTKLSLHKNTQVILGKYSGLKVRIK